MWGVGRFADMADFAERSRALGFCCVELNHQVTPKTLGAAHQGTRTRARCASPAPTTPAPIHRTGWSCCQRSPTWTRTGAWSPWSRPSAPWTWPPGWAAPQSCLHVGDVWEMHSAALALTASVPAGTAGQRRVRYGACNDSTTQTSACQQPYLDSVARSLEALVDHARHRGLQIGIENRYYVNEIPNLEQARWLMERVDPASPGTGTTSATPRCRTAWALPPHRDWLTALGSRIKGVHLHDVLPDSITDHQAAGLGDLDLKQRRRLPARRARCASASSTGRTPKSRCAPASSTWLPSGFFRDRADCSG